MNTKELESCGCESIPCPHCQADDKIESVELLSKFVQHGLLSGYTLTKIYEEPGVEMRTSEMLKLIFPDGHTLTINTMCSGSSENVDLILTAGSVIIDKQ